jgi:hypothetical protein
VLKALSFGPTDRQNHRWAIGGGYHTTLTIFTDPVQSWSLAPLGQSADSTSPFYSNQAQLLSERQLKPTYFNREELLRSSPTVLILDRPPPSR